MLGIQIHVINWCCVNSVVCVYEVLMSVLLPLILYNKVGISGTNGGMGFGAKRHYLKFSETTLNSSPYCQMARY